MGDMCAGKLLSDVPTVGKGFVKGVHSYYKIRTSRLNLNSMMKQTERFETMWQETYSRFIQSEYCPYGYIFNSKIEKDIESYSKEGFYAYLCSNELCLSDGGDVDVDVLLMNTKMDFENEMKENMFKKQQIKK